MTYSIYLFIFCIILKIQITGPIFFTIDRQFFLSIINDIELKTNSHQAPLTVSTLP